MDRSLPCDINPCKKTELPQEKIDILKLWRTKHKKGMLFILEYRPEYAVVLASDEQGEDRLYGIKGISNSVANTLRRGLPAQLHFNIRRLLQC